MTQSARPRLLVSLDEARRLIQQRVDEASTLGGRLIGDGEDLGRLESDLQEWVDATAVVLAGILSPAAIVTAFRGPPPSPTVATNSRLHEGVGAVQAARAVYMERLRQIQRELPRYPSPLLSRVRVPRLSLDDISNKVVGAVIAALLISGGSILVATVVRPGGGTPDDSNSPSVSAEPSSVGNLASPESPAVTPTVSSASPFATQPEPSAAHASLLPYVADWSSGMGGWAGPSDWKTLGGMLLNDGSGEYSVFQPIFAPPPKLDSDYAVEAEIRVIQGGGSSFGIVVRADGNGGGYAAGVGSGWNGTSGISDLRGWWGTSDLNGRLKEGKIFDPEATWHMYRVEVRGNVITLMVGQTVLAIVSDNKYLAGGTVGLWCNQYQLEVRSFKVTSL
jgi:hypothetical protein